MKSKKRLVIVIVTLVLVGIVALSIGVGTANVPSPAVRNADVDPEEGNWNDYFNYSVEVRYYEQTEIELWIYHPAEHDWIFRGTREYNASRDWQTLWWNERPFDRNCEGKSSSYKFVWNGTVLKIGGKERFFGPRIKVPPQRVEFGNATVLPERNATYKTEFNYGIEVNASKTMDIELVVYDPCLRSWISAEEYKTYTYSGAKGEWQMLTWNNTMPFIRTGCKEGVAKFKFNAYYQSKFINVSSIYDGPELVPLIKFENPQVEPPDGRYNWSFNYSVEIANVTEHINISEIKLEVLNPHTLARTTYNQTNSTNNTLIWHVRPFEGDPECRGTARYCFIYGDDVWPEMVPCYGPEITVPLSLPELNGWAKSTTGERNLSKENATECIEYYVHTGYVTPFNFTATSKNTDLDLELLIRDPETGKLERRGGPQHCEAGENVTWNYIKPFDSISTDKIKDCIGKQLNFTCMYQGQVYKEEFEGPELLVAFKNPKYPTSVSYGENFNYSIDVIGSRALNITLEYQNKGNWTADYVSSAEWNYTDIGNWTTHAWNCKAMKEWEDVRFRWWEKGNETEAAEMRSLESKGLQLSASKPKRSCPVHVIVWEEK